MFKALSLIFLFTKPQWKCDSELGGEVYLEDPPAWIYFPKSSDYWADFSKLDEAATATGCNVSEQDFPLNQICALGFNKISVTSLFVTLSDVNNLGLWVEALSQDVYGKIFIKG